MSAADEYVETAWKYMIAAGGVVPKMVEDDDYGDPYWNPVNRDRLGSYYGSTIEIRLDETREVLNKLLAGVTLALDRMLPPDDGIEHRFDHTFTDTQLEVPYLEGTLILSDGSEYGWAVQHTLDRDFGSVIRQLVEVSRRPWEDAIQSLRWRVEAARDQWTFPYHSQEWWNEDKGPLV